MKDPGSTFVKIVASGCLAVFVFCLLCLLVVAGWALFGVIIAWVWNTVIVNWNPDLPTINWFEVAIVGFGLNMVKQVMFGKS